MVIVLMAILRFIWEYKLAYYHYIYVAEIKKLKDMKLINYMIITKIY